MISGMRVVVFADAWLQTLDNLDFPLDGGGGFAILPLADAGLTEMALVFAHPVNALAPLSEPPFGLELAFARGENTVLLGLAAPSPTPDGGAVAFTSVDLGNPVVRERLASLDSHPVGRQLCEVRQHSPSRVAGRRGHPPAELSDQHPE